MEPGAGGETRRAGVGATDAAMGESDSVADGSVGASLRDTDVW